jgi:hypothetical protein
VLKDRHRHTLQMIVKDADLHKYRSGFIVHPDSGIITVYPR